MLIALCGFMGCGKSTLGKVLAQKLGFDFVDTDEYIERDCGMSISSIFEKYGEEAFRDMEHNAIQSLSERENLVVALGGGLPILDKNKAALSAMFVVFIDTPFEVCYERIAGDGTRPIAAAGDKSHLRELYEGRLEHYKAVANIVVRGDNLDNTVYKIAKAYKENVL